MDNLADEITLLVEFGYALALLLHRLTEAHIWVREKLKCRFEHAKQHHDRAIYEEQLVPSDKVYIEQLNRRVGFRPVVVLSSPSPATYGVEIKGRHQVLHPQGLWKVCNPKQLLRVWHTDHYSF